MSCSKEPTLKSGPNFVRSNIVINQAKLKVLIACPPGQAIRKPLISLLILLAFAFAGAAAAQTTPSTDRDNPTPIAANEVKGEGTDEKTEYFYSFTAGPGEVSLTFDVKATKDAYLHGFDYEVFDAKSRRLAGGFLDPVRGESKRKIEKVSVRGQQQLLLRLVLTGYVDTYRIRLEGAVDGAAASSASPSAAAAAQGGNRMCLPTTGTLVIILADGAEERIDLSQVKSAAVKP
jgi:hypothetical protein